jgi:O-antigen ligase
MPTPDSHETGYDLAYEQEAMLQQEAFEHSTRRDGFWAALLIGMIIFGPIFILPGNLPPLRVVDILIVFLWVVRAFKTKRIFGGFVFSPRVRLFSGFMVAMTGVLIFSMSVNIMTGRNEFFFKDLFYPLIFIRMIIIASIAASFNIGERQLRQFGVGILAVAVLSVLLAYGQRSGRFGIALVERFFVADPERLGQLYAGRGRAVGTFGNSNVFAGSLVMLAAILLPLVISFTGRLRYMTVLVLLAIGGSLLVAVGSRTSIISFVFIVMVTLMLSMRKGTRIPTFIVSVLVIALFVLVRNHAYELPIPERLQDLIAPGEGQYLRDSIASRLDMWKYSLQTASESIVVGVGATKIQLQLTDNGYFFTLLRLGIIGLSVYIIMLALLLKRGLKAIRTETRLYHRAVILGFVMVLLTHLIFEVTGEFFWNVRYGELFACFMGLLCGFSMQIQGDYWRAAADLEYEPAAAESAAEYELAYSQE